MNWARRELERRWLRTLGDIRGIGLDTVWGHVFDQYEFGLGSPSVAGPPVASAARPDFVVNMRVRAMQRAAFPYYQATIFRATISRTTQ